MASIAMLVGGALVNALAFSGSNYLFTMLKSSGADEERKRHDKAIEQLQAAHETWTKRRTERTDWIAEDLRRQGHAVKTFRDVDEVMRVMRLMWRSPGKRTALISRRPLRSSTLWEPHMLGTPRACGSLNSGYRCCPSRP